MRLNRQGSSTQYANLNEQQSTLILTFMRNSDVVVDFKKRLVREFYRMKNHLNQPPVAPQLPQNKLQILSQALMIAQEEWKPKADSYDGSYSGA